MDRKPKQLRALGFTTGLIATFPLLIKPVAGVPADTHANPVCTTVPCSLALPKKPAATSSCVIPAEKVASFSLTSPSDAQDDDDIVALCEAIENGCLKGCERGADILVRWGLIEEGDVDAYIDRCMWEHCDSPCKPRPD